MRNITETQNRTARKIMNEFEKSNIRVFEDRIGLVQNSKTDDVYRYLRGEKQFEVYIYEDGEVNISGPLRKRVFELPDFSSQGEMESSIIEEIILQARPGEIPGELFQKLEARRKKSRFHLMLVLLILATIFFWARSKS